MLLVKSYGEGAGGKLMNYIEEQKQQEIIIDKMMTLQLVWRRWIELYQNNIKIEQYFKKKGIKKIAIYGMADIGIALYRELMQSDIEVCYGIDKMRHKCEYEVEIRTPEEIDFDMDMIVVTAVSYFGMIYDDLSSRLENRIPIIGIDEVIIELLIGEDGNEMEESRT